MSYILFFTTLGSFFFLFSARFWLACGMYFLLIFTALQTEPGGKIEVPLGFLASFILLPFRHAILARIDRSFRWAWYQVRSLTKEKSPAPETEKEMLERLSKREQAYAAQLKKEPNTTVLRKQIPIRFGEPQRSWLGGLPMMPDHIDWPVSSESGTVLHFLAQICCEDLPADIWGGKGLRQGWLLFFFDALDGENWSKNAATIYIEDLGPERAPPKELPRLSAEVVDIPLLADEAERPQILRRWPVDLVSVKQSLVKTQPGYMAPAGLTSDAVYGQTKTSSDRDLDPQIAHPLTWGAAASFFRWQISRLKGHLQDNVESPVLEIIQEEGVLPKMVAETQAFVEEIEQRLHAQRAELDETPVENHAKRAETSELITSLSDRFKREKSRVSWLEAHLEKDEGETLFAEIKAHPNTVRKWKGAAIDTAEALLQTAREHDHDAPLPAEEWAKLQKAMTACSFTKIESAHNGRDRMRSLVKVEVSLATYLEWSKKHARDHYYEMYTKSPQSNALIPNDLRNILEGNARKIAWDRTHRMGGFPDYIQWDPDPKSSLLFQFASDRALDIMWGDAGAVFFDFEETDLLTAENEVEASFQCN